MYGLFVLVFVIFFHDVHYTYDGEVVCVHVCQSGEEREREKATFSISDQAGAEI